MQALRSRRNIRVCAVILSLAAAIAFSGGESALAEDPTKDTTTTGTACSFVEAMASCSAIVPES